MIQAALTLLALSAGAAEPRKLRFEKAVVVIFENTGFKDAVKQPFFAAFAKRGALLTDYHGVAHPSQPNYVALVAGSPRGVKDDARYDLPGRSLADLLEAKGLDWKQYAEDYPGSCSLRPRFRRYARKHAPLISFVSIQKDLARCARAVEARQFFVDLSSRTLPAFSLFVPDLSDDGHDTGVAFADKWFSKKFGALLEKWPNDTLLVATFDESESYEDTNQVYTAFFGDMVKPGAADDARYDHYSLLRTLEDNWELGDLGGNDAKAKAVAGVWR